MNAVRAPERIAHASPRVTARITGLIYLTYFVTVVVGAFYTPRTTTGFVAPESSFWVGYALTLTSTACYVAVVALFSVLFRSVSSSAAWVAVCFGLMGCAMTAIANLFQLAPAIILGDHSDLRGFDAQQTRALAQVLLDLNARAVSISLVFFAVFLLLISYLIFRCAFLPRLLAIPIALAGVGWLTVLVPPLASLVLGYVEVVGAVAEVALMLWLLIVGVNELRWYEQANATELSARA